MSEIYRDRSEGAAARREDLLRRRRNELALLPHAVRRVVVARSARIGASLAVAALGATLIAAAACPATTAKVAAVLPNKPAVLTALLVASWLVGVFAWWVARARCEHKFAVAMSRYVLPGRDLDADLQRLDHEHPDELARTMAHRLEIRSAALPVLASALLVPATAVYLDTVRHAPGWPAVSAIEAALSERAGILAAIALAGAVFALLTTRPALRSRMVASWALALAAIAAPVALAVADLGKVELAWMFVAVFAVAVPLGFVGRKLARERAAIAASDPAAGSEVLTLRALLKAARTRAVALRGWLHAARRRPFGWGHGLTLLAVGIGGIVFVARSHRVATPRFEPQNLPSQHAAAEANPDASYRIVPLANGDLAISLSLQADDVADIQLNDELPTVPRGWYATVTVSADREGLTVSAGSAPEQRLHSDHAVTLDLDGCAIPQPPLALHLQHSRHGSAYGHTEFQVQVTPVLRVAKCD